jgi:trehalose 6-phosphate synthase
MTEREHWRAIGRWSPLAVIADLDGTLIPFAPTPDQAKPDDDLLALLRDLASSPGTTAAVVSGRPRETLQSFFEGCPDLALVAEHGGWRRGAGAWESTPSVEKSEIETLVEDLRRIASRYPGALVERKTWSTAFHFRSVAPEEQDAALVDAEYRIARWLEKHPPFEELRGDMVLEVRPARMNKGSAVPWLRDRAGANCRILALGDDITDEDTFRAISTGDESIIIGDEIDRPTTARWRLSTVDHARTFLRWIVQIRRGDEIADPPAYPRRITLPSLSASRASNSSRLLVVSNRLPELRSAASSFDVRKRNVGGLVSALEPALASRHGIWLGWSGRSRPGADPTAFGLDESSHPSQAWVDFPEDLQRDYYNGFCNSALWPLLHSFPGRVRFSEQAWTAYKRANESFAVVASQLVGMDDPIWIHDYHLFLMADRLRDHGHEGPLGLFLHVPFPGPDIFFILPWAEELLTALLRLDLIGFHTPIYAKNFLHCASVITETRVGDDAIEYRGRRTRVRSFPIGIIPERFQEPARGDSAKQAESLMRSIAPTQLVLGVDRLDYTKGIPERISAFGRLLELHPEWRRKVSLVQISVPSRSDVPEYEEQRQRIEQIVGRTNGEFGDADWVPVRYLYRSFDHSQLSLLYRKSRVGYVTPLRDGMNLVAKEFVAAQDPQDPGVLVLSRFAGAASELTEALLTNPWYLDGLAHDLDRALRMGLEERRERHRKLLARVSQTTAITWAEDFLAALSRCANRKPRS